MEAEVITTSLSECQNIVTNQRGALWMFILLFLATAFLLFRRIEQNKKLKQKLARMPLNKRRGALK